LPARVDVDAGQLRGRRRLTPAPAAFIGVCSSDCTGEEIDHVEPLLVLRKVTDQGVKFGQAAGIERDHIQRFGPDLKSGPRRAICD
jgi:hypothetical protein